MNPTLIQAILAGIGVLIGTAVILYFGTYLISEWWRTRKGSTKYYYAYGDRQCECKFITGGRK